MGTRSQREPVTYITCTRLRVLQGVRACYNHITIRQGRYLAAGLAPGVKHFDGQTGATVHYMLKSFNLQCTTNLS